MGKVAADMVEVAESEFTAVTSGEPLLEVRLAGEMIERYPPQARWAHEAAERLRRALARIPEAEGGCGGEAG